ncbi:hypothetical protein GALMADRAFT_258246 [Galerina marginata CBS 339.88]|uniref:Uncharacterized protein n=1 Tax=Galerina marginata (strain CBS 339.88) TaxID=685588 RepID=A0A067SLD0_GALM3|nr:hypothetical protein GALMADRAFT_258246 [Galerina marginata CBS 339.88]
MRLLDVHQLKLKEFFDEKTQPQYAILSHTWREGEVSLQDLSTPAANAMAGFSKIKRCCELAIQDGFNYVWIDTCCIDKTSSSELSEAINSMYQWYKSATVCYAYLSDVVPGEDPTDPDSSFSESRWFNRGWTLQELLAPKTVIFYDSDWNEIGTKFNLKSEISRITGISHEALSNEPIGGFSTAQRMSWAAKRETTRVEDIAYSLIGIFEVNMSTLYGEGQRAFIRLQYEILRTSDDHSLFAWTNPRTTVPWRYLEPEHDTLYSSDFPSPDSGLLASSPLQFQNSHLIQRLDVPSSGHPYSMTNKGLHIWLPIAPLQRDSNPPIYKAILNCSVAGETSPLSIYLRQTRRSGQYYRIFMQALHLINNIKHDLAPVELYVKEAYPEIITTPSEYSMSVTLALPPTSIPTLTIHLVEHPSVEQGYTLVECEPKNFWDENTGTFQVDMTFGGVFLYFIVETNDREKTHAMVVFGVEDDFLKSETPLCCAIYSGAEISKTKKAFKRSQIKVDALTTRDVDRIMERLPSGHIISIALRLQPAPDTLNLTFNYRVTIKFNPPSWPYPRLTNRHLVSLHTISPLPQLAIYLDCSYPTNFAIHPLYPKSNWLVIQPDDEDAVKLTWTPTEHDSPAFLGLSTESRKLKFPLLIFHVIDNDIAVEFVEAPLSLLESDWDTLLPIYLDWLDTNRTLHRSSNFPKVVEVAGDTLQIKMRPKTLPEETGHQMLVVTSRASTAGQTAGNAPRFLRPGQKEEKEELTVKLGIGKRSSAWLIRP